MESELWTQGASPWPHEREALAFIRARFPGYEPYRAWTNVEFIAEDGSVNEVDLLAVTPRGLFLVEIKSWRGVLRGDGQRWRRKLPNGSTVVVDHPLVLTNSKARRLRSLLMRQRAFKGDQSPFVTPLVFLSSEQLDCRLQGIARTAVCGRDPDAPPPGATPAAEGGAVGRLPGIVAALKNPGTVDLRGTPINKPLSARIALALDQAGLRPLSRGRRAGDWELNDLLDEGPGWQDFEAARPRIGVTRRVRVYLAGAATTAEEEKRLRRQAEREFRVVQDLRHEGIAQPLDLVQAERGPALLFERVQGEERLDLWAPEGIADLGLEARIELVRQLGEAIAHAHSHKVTHRALTARSVLVRPSSSPGGSPRLVIGHWQAGVRELATRLTRHPDSTSGSTLGTDLTERLDAAEQVYLAPEAFSVEHPDGTAMDVFSLGALAFLLLAGQPPASDLTEREAMLAAHHGLALDAAVDGLPEDLATLVAVATDPVPARRATVRELLDLLDETLEQLTAPEPAEPEPEATTAADPLTAHQGDVLDGGWHVLRRLGGGSTAVALLCRRSGSSEPEVLKVAKDEQHAERLRDEARALEQLRHPGIVELGGVERIGGRTALRLAPAGDPDDKLGMTLADRLAAQGRLGLDLLERFGDDLLEVVAYLESEGIPHRDIKPDNLGVRPRRGDRSLHLVLFDFSLARTPDTSLGAGTPGYLDPFLSERPQHRWDPAADRYAAAATLHEMATGTRPVWGDNRTDPVHLDDQVPHIDVELLDPSVRDGLLHFFGKALHRGPASRYDTADQMRLAWRAVFTVAARPVITTDEDRAADIATLERLADAAGLDTPVAELGLSGAAASALERLGLGIVEQLLAYPTADWNRARGVGLRVRREVLDAIGRLRPRFDAEPGDPAASIDRLAGQLIAKPITSKAQADRDPLELLLGLPGDRAQLTLGVDDSATHDQPQPPWPGPSDVKARFDLDRAGYDGLLERARMRWSKQPAITQVRHDLQSILERAGGVLPADEVALALLAQRGSMATGADRLRRARAVVRAALETEAARSTNRFTWRRLGGGASAVIALRSDALDAEELADYAASLGVVADQLASADPLLSPAVALQRLRHVPTPTGLPPLSDHRLARLAAASSATAAVSSRIELYPRGLPVTRALRLARAALLVSGTLSENDIRTRVWTRFPASQPLPGRPTLDQLLKEAVGLEWFSGGPGPTGAPLAPGFRVPPPPAVVAATGVTSSGGRFRTGTTADVTDEARASAEIAQDRLERHAKAGGFLVITVRPSQQQRAIAALSNLDATPMNVDALVIGALRRHAEAKHIKWDQAILAADAEGPAGERWGRLLTVVRNALTPVRAELLNGPAHLLLTHPGLLARYDALGLLDELRERVTRQPEPGQTLRTLWVLVPADDPAALPTMQGKAIPVTSSAEHFPLPDAWLRNLHRTHPSPVPGGLT
ncbi:MAG TPA: BREX system serine/threonine kinase PglW [Actinomycetes bacterium]|jgi:serine/threonine protein kinase|nr:BREX system serine/threonine kinase PglW [Actinomycetes bacterium]